MSRRPLKIPSMLVGMIEIALPKLDGMVFDTVSACPHCGGKPLPHDFKKKNYATIITSEGEEKTITVKVKRFRCDDCGALIYAEEPFYPKTRVGSAIIDLAISLSRIYTYSHTTEIMGALGIKTDKGSVRNYAKSSLPVVQTSLIYGMQLPNSFVSLMSKCASFTDDINAEDVIVASGYPARYTPPENLDGTAGAFTGKKRSKVHY